jgi:hypothetical protein
MCSVSYRIIAAFRELPAAELNFNQMQFGGMTGVAAS